MSLKPTRQPQPTKDLSLEQGVRWIDGEPYYLPTGNEVSVFTKCHERGLPVMLKGPTGCGKTRFIEHMAARLERMNKEMGTLVLVSGATVGRLTESFPLLPSREVHVRGWEAPVAVHALDV